MEIEINPEPSEEERAALLAAVAALLDGDRRPDAYRSAWREQGIRENLDEQADEDSRRDRPAAEQTGGDSRVVEP